MVDVVASSNGAGNVGLVKIFQNSAVLFLLVIIGVTSCANDHGSVTGSKSFDDVVEPILAEYCYDCHGDGMDKGDIELDHHMSFAELKADRDLWEGVYSNIDTQLMPPSDKKQLSDEERANVLAWIENDVFKLNRKNPDPGKPVIRRLNKSEYNNSIRDLFGISIKPADKFPADDTGYGFDNIGEVLTLSPALFERYLQASEEVMDVVIPTEPLQPKRLSYRPEKFTKRAGNPSRGVMASHGTVGVRFSPDKDGLYRIKILARGSQAGNEWPIMRVKIEGAQQKDIRVSSRNRVEYTMEARLRGNRKSRWVDASFINDHYDPKAKDPLQRDRNLYVERIEIAGPIFDKPPAASAIYKELLSQTSAEKSETGKARVMLDSIASRAWRRPLEKGDIDRLVSLFSRARKQGQSFDESVKFAIKAVLISQRFLFRGETESAEGRGKKDGAYVEVDEYTLASRLSFFLWSSLPDDELLALAKQGELRNQMAVQIKRMIADQRFDALTDNFAGQWLQLRNLQLSSPDPKEFRGWSNDLRRSMRKETELLFTFIARENRPVLDFINANYSFLDRRLADHYGMKGRVKTDTFKRVHFSDRDYRQRGGLLTHASILTITSDSTRTSPVNRGNYVLENIMGTIPPPPPEGLEIPALETAKKGKQNLSLRQQLEIHREDKLCSSCHARMDPIGFAMENFDGYGKWRDRDNGQPIDTKGKLYTGEDFEGISGLRSLLVEKKSEAFLKCLAEKLLTYALGRGVEYYDKPALNEIVEKTVAEDYRFQEMIEAVVASVPFQKTRVESKTVR